MWQGRPLSRLQQFRLPTVARRTHLFNAHLLVNDEPTLGELAKDRCEGTMQRLAVRHRPLPFSICVGRVWVEKVNGFDVAYPKLAHLVSAILVHLAKTVQDTLPPLVSSELEMKVNCLECQYPAIIPSRSPLFHASTRDFSADWTAVTAALSDADVCSRGCAEIFPTSITDSTVIPHSLITRTSILKTV